MAQTSKLGIEYDFNGSSLSDNSDKFRIAVQEVMIYNFSQKYKENDDPIVIVEKVAYDLAELIEEYVITATITINAGEIETDSTGNVTNPVTTGSAVTQTLTSTATTSSGESSKDVSVSSNDLLSGGGLS
jgi:hypothetical protein